MAWPINSIIKLFQPRSQLWKFANLNFKLELFITHICHKVQMKHLCNLNMNSKVQKNPSKTSRYELWAPKIPFCKYM
jgi:hypothetical protein